MAFSPKPCAEGGYGRDNRWNWGTQFKITQPIRITHLCRMLLSPTGDDVTGMTVQLWSLTPSTNLLTSAVMETNVGSFCLSGGSAVFLGAPITPIVLSAGDYLV